MFKPQSVETEIEINELAAVHKQIISPATSTPTIKIVQDSMIASYLITQLDFATTGERAFQYLMTMTKLKSDFDFFKIREKEKWSGKDLFSAIMPNISLKNIIYDGDVYVKGVEIKNGTLVDGIMAKDTLGGGSNGIIQAIFNQCGPEICRDFLDNLQRFAISYMEDHGFTVGFGDAIPPKEVRKEIKQVLEEKKREAEELILKAQMGLFEPNLSEELKAAKLELEIGNIGSASTEAVEKLVTKKLPPDNNFKRSVNSGSKGKDFNLNQIAGTVGQQEIDGRRITYGYTGRVLPHFTKYDQSLQSRGYVFNSYMNGLNPAEFYSAAMGSRVSAVQGNIQTAETGYKQRQMGKAMEDLKVAYDGTVRDASNNIVQYCYGVDGYDSIKLEHISISILKKNNQEMKDAFYWNAKEIISTYKSIFTKKAFDNFQKNFDENEKILKNEWKQLMKDRDDLRNKYFAHEDDTSKILTPVNIKRLIHHMINQFKIKKYGKTDMTPLECYNMIQETVEYVSNYRVDNDFSPLIKIFIRSNLTTLQCMYKFRFTSAIMRLLIDTIKRKILDAIVNPGEMVGIISAQSIGEPMTQMTLNTFHFSGLGSKSVLTTAGVPRIKEITQFSKDIKTPSMTIYLKPEYRKNKNIALELKNQVEYTEIKDLVNKADIMYISDKAKGVYPEEEEEFKLFQEIIEQTGTKCPDPDNLSNWVLWIEFDRESMLRKNIFIDDIHEKIIQNFNLDSDISCVISNMNSEHITLRVRMLTGRNDGENYVNMFKQFGDEILSLQLRGINGIKKIGISSQKKKVYLPDGSMKLIDEWVLNSDGSNLIAILSNDFVDIERTTTNDLNEIYRLFGIEGVRQAIIREMEETIKGTKEINKRHYEILADFMTYRGSVMNIQRNGFGKSPYMGPIGRATFEVMDRVLVTAGIFAEKDDMEGTSSRVITAQPVKAGTNYFDVYMNTDLLPETDEKLRDFGSGNIYIENFVSEKEINQDFINKIKSSEDIKLGDYLQAIGAQPVNVDDSDFNFGYSVLEEADNPQQIKNLPEIKIPNIGVTIVESKNVPQMRRRRRR